MSFIGGALVAQAATVQTTKQITLTTAGTEYSYTFPANTKYFNLWINQAAVVRYATISGNTNVAGEYVEIEGGGGILSSGISGSPTIYFQANLPNIVVNLQSWA